MAAHTPHRYQRLADELALAVRSGLLRAGDRLPSVRESCRRHGISPSTVFQAYGLLETWGLVEARERSGIFVRAQRRPQPAAPQAAAARPEATPVAVSELVFELLGAAADPALVPLGSAFPAPGLFPFDELARCGARALRKLNPAHIAGALLAGDEGLRLACAGATPCTAWRLATTNW
jgi:DNA-binding transcriptional MocR family regulator